jgi:hypothetical protein
MNSARSWIGMADLAAKNSGMIRAGVAMNRTRSAHRPRIHGLGAAAGCTSDIAMLLLERVRPRSSIPTVDPESGPLNGRSR